MKYGWLCSSHVCRRIKQKVNILKTITIWLITSKWNFNPNLQSNINKKFPLKVHYNPTVKNSFIRKSAKIYSYIYKWPKRNDILLAWWWCWLFLFCVLCYLLVAIVVNRLQWPLALNEQKDIKRNERNALKAFQRGMWPRRLPVYKHTYIC